MSQAPKLAGKYSPVEPVAYGAPIICPNATTARLNNGVEYEGVLVLLKMAVAELEALTPNKRKRSWPS